MSIAAFLRENSALIVARWIEETRQLESARTLLSGEVRDELAGIIAWLAGDSSGPDDALRAHLDARVRSGFSLRELVREFVGLARVLQAMAGESPDAPSEAEMAALLERVGTCIDRALRSFKPAAPAG